MLLAMFTLFVSSAQYVGDPIHCWCPATFTGAYVAYAKHVCWISNTYYVPMEDTIPLDLRERQDKEISYYQWVPIIFLFMAFMFKCPNIVWRLFCNGAGLNMDKITTMAEGTQIGSGDDREKTIYHIAKYMDRWLMAHRQYTYNVFVRMRQRISGVFCFFLGKRDGTYLTGFYLFVKLLFVVNVIGQFFLLNSFLSMDYSVYGFEVIRKLSQEEPWRESPRFPRVTLCDFDIRQLQNLQRWTVQCVLPINLFNEKIFIFLWFWIFFVATLTCMNYLSWLYHVLIGLNRARYVKKYLKLADEIRSTSDSKLCRKFADEYLRNDGVFVLRVIAKNSSELVLKDLVIHLWKIFRDDPRRTLRPIPEVNHRDINHHGEEIKEGLA